jgi:hypothetical protein
MTGGTWLRRGKDLLRLEPRGAELAVAKLAGGALVDEPAIPLWPTAPVEVSVGLSGGAPAAWIDDPERAGLLVRLLDKLEVRALPAQEAEPAEVCGAAHAAWPRVFAPHVRGRHHAVKLEAFGSVAWLATSGALLGVGPAGEACREALLVEAPWDDARGWLSLAGSATSAVVRATKPGRLAVDAMECWPSKESLPEAAADYPEFRGP